jgi:hypothetical protein
VPAGRNVITERRASDAVSQESIHVFKEFDMRAVKLGLLAAAALAGMSMSATAQSVLVYRGDQGVDVVDTRTGRTERSAIIRRNIRSPEVTGSIPDDTPGIRMDDEEVTTIRRRIYRD